VIVDKAPADIFRGKNIDLFWGRVTSFISFSKWLLAPPLPPKKVKSLCPERGMITCYLHPSSSGVTKELSLSPRWNISAIANSFPL
jgi:hypothetical protein